MSLLDLSGLPLFWVAAIFAAAALAIALAGVKLAAVADDLAATTGLGETVMGAVFVGATTSLGGTVTSVTAAAQGHPSLAIGNAIGGIAAQTAFLGLADLLYRKANLEHAAASVANLMQGAFLVSLLAVPLIAWAAPDYTLFGISPASPVLVIGYVLGVRLLWRAKLQPMWAPRRTRETRIEEEEPLPRGLRTGRLWLLLGLLAVATGAAGYVIAQAGVAVVAHTGLSETAVGVLFTAVATSLPELVTVLAAVHRGALNLAVGDILGGNSFDVLFLVLADAAYRDGSIYGAFRQEDIFVVSLSILMTGILLLGLLHREKRGIAGIGFESAIILALYAFAVPVVLR